jgi:phosphonate transport system substrate-binding protein
MGNPFRTAYQAPAKAWWTSLGILLIVTAIILTTAVQAGRKVVYRVGVVPQFEIRKIHDAWEPLLQELEKRTGYRFDLQGSKSIGEFEKQFLAGQFDLAYMNPYHLIMANKAQGYQPILRDLGKKLQGVLVVANDSNITDIGQLSDQRIAFPSPNALGASLLMRAELHDQFGLAFEPLYVKTHDSVYLNTVLGQTAAGGGIEKTLQAQNTQIRSRLRVIHKTQQVNAHPIAVHPRLPDDVIHTVTRAFIELSHTPGGRKLLSEIPIENIGTAQISDYADLSAMRLERFYQPAP